MKSALAVLVLLIGGQVQTRPVPPPPVPVPAPAPIPLPPRARVVPIPLHQPAAVDPLWWTRPTQAEIMAAWPERAMRVDGDISARLECIIQGGRPTSCSVISETPKAMGFGASALRLAPYYRTAMPAGTRVVFDVEFTTPVAISRNTIKDPRWARLPTDEEITEAQPLRTEWPPLGISEPRALIRCRARAGGELHLCEVLTATDPHMARMALDLAPHFRLDPRQNDRLPIEGRYVETPVVVRTALDSGGLHRHLTPR